MQPLNAVEHLAAGLAVAAGLVLALARARGVAELELAALVLALVAVVLLLAELVESAWVAAQHHRELRQREEERQELD